MLPTLSITKDWVVISKSYRFGHGIEIGDIVSFQHPTEPHRALKRVIANEGDFVARRFVTIKDGYVRDAGGSELMIRIPEGHVWLEGDNKSLSKDSRLYGPVAKSLVDGKVIGIFRWNPFYYLWRTRRVEDEKAGFREID
jgi:inner membrane protease subunit 1